MAKIGFHEEISEFLPGFFSDSALSDGEGILHYSPGRAIVVASSIQSQDRQSSAVNPQGTVRPTPGTWQAGCLKGMWDCEIWAGKK
jgi:hypothetical protein